MPPLLRSEPQTTEELPSQTNESAENAVDLNALAEKVYRLLQEEAQIERERLGRRQAW